MLSRLATLSVLAFALFSCAQKMVCPAYQSAFILDKETKRKQFSYFEQDSTFYGNKETGVGKMMANPKILTASKDKYLIAVPESYRKRFRKMQTVERRVIYPVNPDSLISNDSSNFDLMDETIAEIDASDSLSTEKADFDESGFVKKQVDFKLTKTKEHYNLDQDFYMWFLRRMLVLPDIRYHLELEKQEIARRNVVKKPSAKNPSDDSKPVQPDKKRKEKTSSGETGKSN
jgi:hypothetical protein